MSKIKNFIINIYKKSSNHINGWFDGFEFSETLKLFFITNHKYISLILIFEVLFIYFNSYLYKINIFSVIIFAFYQVIYTRYGLQKSIRSFVFFYLNFGILTLMIWTLINIIFGLNHPIYVEDLSIFSVIRYALFIIIALLGITLFWSLKISKKPQLKVLYSTLTYPYLAEEITKLLRVFEDTIFGPFFEWLLHQLYLSKPKQYLLFSLHFILCYIISFIQALLFLNFAFFHGDLRYVLYCIPLSLFSWMFKILWYYFTTFITTNGDNLRQLIYVKYNDLTIFNNNKNIVMIKEEFLDITLREPSGDLLSDNLLLKEFKHLFIVLGVVHSSITTYISYTKNVSYIILCLRFISWSYIIFVFFDYSSLKNAFLNPITQISTFKRLIFLPTRGYVTESFLIKKAHHKSLEALSKGAYKSGHPVTTDTQKVDENGKVPFYSQPTHGKGPQTNPSKILSPDMDLNGENRQQNAVYPEHVFRFEKDWLDAPIKDSVEYHNRPDVRANDKKNNTNYSKESQE